MISYHSRLVEGRLKRLAGMFPIVVVVGGRQVGKTTLLRHFLDDSVKCFTFDPVDDLYGARSDPDLFLDQYQPPLLLDEVQYATELLPALKRRVDEMAGRRGLYFLSGSQNLSVLRDVAESMAGRAGILELPAFSLAEWEDLARPGGPEPWLWRWLRGPQDFARDLPERVPPTMPLAQRLWRGLLPGLLEVANPEDTPEFLRSFVLTYIERDVRRTGNVEELEAFRRFMGLMAALTGRQVNVSQVGRDLGIARATATKWLALLAATYQWLPLPPYHGNTVKRVSGHPKGHLHDTGLACFLQRLSSPEAVLVSPLLGALFETYVITGIGRQIAGMRIQPARYHWRTLAGAEVDLVLELDGRLWPFECKASTRIGGHDTAGIRAFRKTYPGLADTPAAIVAPVPEPRRLGEDIWALPYDLVG
jgi:predicted AAA+ superfamily ATPase